jgi:hypothetical protein
MQAVFSVNARQAGRLQKLNDASFIPLAGQHGRLGQLVL